MREAFQAPKFINFNDISEINLEGKNLTIKAGGCYKYQFHMPEAHELAPVFDALVEWLSGRANNEPISAKELIQAREKLSASEECFRLLMRLSMQLIEEEEDERKIIEATSLCIDEIHSLQNKIDNQSITEDELVSISRVSAILESSSAVLDDPLNKKIDQSLLIKTRVDGVLFDCLSRFLPSMTKAFQEAITNEITKKKVSSFLKGNLADDTIFRHAAGPRSLIANMQGDAATPFGKIFVQRLGLGMASYHFEAKNTCYISYKSAPEDWMLDNGEKIPSRKEFKEIFYDKKTRIFAAWVIWFDSEGSTFNGDARWLYQIHFNEDCTEIVAGTVLAFNEYAQITQVDRFGVELKYQLLTEESV